MLLKPCLRRRRHTSLLNGTMQAAWHGGGMSRGYLNDVTIVMPLSVFPFVGKIKTSLQEWPLSGLALLLYRKCTREKKPAPAPVLLYAKSNTDPTWKMACGIGLRRHWPENRPIQQMSDVRKGIISHKAVDSTYEAKFILLHIKLSFESATSLILFLWNIRTLCCRSVDWGQSVAHSAVAIPAGFG